jgi:hypothetical protein
LQGNFYPQDIAQVTCQGIFLSCFHGV